MRTIIGIAGLLLASLSLAQGIPSAASGVYLGSDRVCRLVLSRYQVSWILIDARCLTFDGRATTAVLTRFAPNTCLNDASFALDPQTQSEFLSLRAMDDTGEAINVVIGSTATGATNGIGVVDTWDRIGVIQSPAPFTCGSAAPRTRPQLCGEFGWFCG